MWARCKRWILPAAGALFAVVFFLPEILRWFNESFVGSGVASAAAEALAPSVER